MDDAAKELLKRGDRLFGAREQLLGLWQDIAEHFYPERADFLVDNVLNDKFSSHLFDGAPVLMRRDLGNAFAAMLRPRGQPWFSLTADETIKSQPGVAEWLDGATAIMRRVLYARGAQFVRATKETDHDYAAFGNGVISCEANKRKDGLVFRNWHPRDCVWVENDDGIVDTIWRDEKRSARQIQQRFPKADLHGDIKKALEKDPEKKFKVRHVMLPMDDYDGNIPKPHKKMRFASVYIDVDHKQVLSEMGSHEFRYVVPRWQTISGSQYAVSPAAIVALPDARMLQSLARILLESGEKAVDPPTKATEGAVRGPINLFAGGVTWVDREYDERTGSPIEPIGLGERPDLGAEMLQRLQSQLINAWYLNKLTLPAQAKTAYETAQLVEEFIRAAIPLFEPMETEYNVPLLDEAATVLLRIGAFGSPDQLPQALSNQDLEFSFSNPLQDAIERNKVNQATTVLGIAAGVSKIPGGEDAMGELDLDVMMRDSVTGSGAPAKWLKSPEAVAQQNAAKAQAQGAANNQNDIVTALQGAGQAADVVNKGAAAAARLQAVGQVPQNAMPQEAAA